MKKNWLLLAAITLLLTSCNLPVRRTLLPPSNDVALGTQVAYTLTSVAVTTHPPVTTDIPGTLAVTATPTLPTATPTAPAPTLLPTPTISGDPRQSLGTPAWQDPLDDGGDWGLEETGYQDDALGVKVENGSLLMTNYQAQGQYRWWLSGQRPQNFYLEATLHTQNCSAADTYGLVFRAPDYYNGPGYYLRLRCSGEYMLTAWTEERVNLTDWQTHSALLGGSNQTNRIGVLANGSTIALYANGQLLQTVTDSSLSAAGHIGVFISAVTTPGFTFEMSEISYWNLP
ncbi:MAG TPA: hypothetical protein PKG95_02565 [Anaerolineaceae bacterium]|nr:hypothetical protein [Anaerolineaceae bacterium]